MKIRDFVGIKTILFDNLTVKQTIFKNTFWSTIAVAMDRLLKFILLIYVARILGATEYGKFTFALSFTSLFVVFHSFGLHSIITREFAREEEKKEEFYSIMSLKVLLSFGAFILILLSSFFITSSPDIRRVILILAIFSLLNGFTTIFYAFFQARQRMEYETWAELLQAVIVTGTGLLVLFKFPSVENLSYSYLFSGLAGLIFVVIFFNFKIFPLKIYWEKIVWRKFLIMSWPLALTGLFGTLYTYIDSVMLGCWGMITETGWYNAAYRVIFIALMPMALISGSFYPVLSNFFKKSKEKLQKVWAYQTELMILLSFPLVVGGIVLAPRIIDFVYGPDFTPAILAFQILTIMAGLIFLCRPFYDVMIASDQQKKTFLVTFWGALIDIILNLILIPKYSLYGAAVATVITYIFILLLYFKYTMKYTPIHPLNLKFLFVFIIAAISTAFMYFVIIQPVIYNLNIFLTVFVGAIIYATVFLVLRKTYDVFKIKNNL